MAGDPQTLFARFPWELNAAEARLCTPSGWQRSRHASCLCRAHAANAVPAQRSRLPALCPLHVPTARRLNPQCATPFLTPYPTAPYPPAPCLPTRRQARVCRGPGRRHHEQLFQADRAVSHAGWQPPCTKRLSQRLCTRPSWFHRLLGASARRARLRLPCSVQSRSLAGLAGLSALQRRWFGDPQPGQFGSTAGAAQPTPRSLRLPCRTSRHTAAWPLWL